MVKMVDLDAADPTVTGCGWRWKSSDVEYDPLMLTRAHIFPLSVRCGCTRLKIGTSRSEDRTSVKR